MREIYLDNAATTRVKESVFSAMKPFFLGNYGNPSSLHEMGEKAEKEINNARKLFAKEIGALPEEIIFTSGGTESNNLAIQGVVNANKNKKKNKILVSSIEHPCVMEVCKYLGGKYNVVKIPVGSSGLIDFNFLEKEIDNKTLMVSVMHANNIIGTVQDITLIGKMCSKKGVLFHTDAVQTFGKIKIDVKRACVSLLSASAHKIGGPKGGGLLYLKKGTKINPILYGGGQERGLRSGTENVPGIIGFAKALEKVKKIDQRKIQKIRDYLIDKLESSENLRAKINGSKKERLANNVHVSFPGIENETLVAFLSHKGIYVSAGSACDSNKEKEDHVLKALGLSRKEISGSIRITLNEEITKKDVDFVIKNLEKSVEKLRG